MEREGGWPGPFPWRKRLVNVRGLTQASGSGNADAGGHLTLNTASVTPNTGESVLLYTSAFAPGGGQLPLSVSGLGLTWQRVAGFVNGAGVDILWLGTGPAPSTGAIAMACTTTVPFAMVNMGWAVVAVAADGPLLLPQHVFASGSGNGPAQARLGGFQSPSSPTLIMGSIEGWGAAGVSSTTPKAGYTQIYSAGGAAPPSSVCEIDVFYHQDWTPSFSYATSGVPTWGMFAIELDWIRGGWQDDIRPESSLPRAVDQPVRPAIHQRGPR